MVGYDEAYRIANDALPVSDSFGIAYYAETPEFWLFSCAYADGRVRDENPWIAVVMKDDGSVSLPIIPSDAGFEILDRANEYGTHPCPEWEHSKTTQAQLKARKGG